VAFYVPLMGRLMAPGADLPPGGAETQIFLLARALAGRGVRVCAVAYQTAEGLPDEVAGIEIIVRPPPRWREIRGPAGKLAEIVAAWRTVGRIPARVFVQRGTGIDTGLVAVAAKARGRRFAYSSANVIDFDYGRVDRRRTVMLFRLGIRLADTIVVQTREQERLCRERFRRDCVVIQSIAEPAEQRACRPDAFLWIGKLASYKRPMAYLELARAVPEATFRMVAVASEKDSAPIAAELELEAAQIPNLQLLPPLPRSELLPLMDRAVAVVNTADYEGMPNIFLEGWARGVPAIALSHDPDGLIEREGLGGFAHGSPERLADLARACWRTRDDQSAVAERCRDYVAREHSVDVLVSRWMEALGLAHRGARAAQSAELETELGAS
jgi:hypothetical protein